MGGLTGIMAMAAQALQVDEGALDVTSNNIANANTPGYTREVVNLSSSAPVTVGDVTYGTGVQLDSVTSVRDALVQLQIDEENGQQGSSQAQLSAMQQVQDEFSSTTTGIGTDITAFFSSLSDLSTDPSDSSDRQAVLTAAQNLASSFNDSANELDQIQSSLNQSVTDTVSQINELTGQIASLNEQVAEKQQLGQEPGALEDQRDYLVQQLSSLTNVSVTQTAQGETLTTGNGTPLVVADQSYALSTTTDSSGMVQVMSQGQNITSSLEGAGGGGTLGGTLVARDQTIPEISNQIDTLASQFASSMNSANEAGYDLNGNAGQALFTAPSSDPAGDFAVAITNPDLIAASSDGTSGSNGNVANLLAVQTNDLPSGATPEDVYSGLVAQVGTLTSQAQANVTASSDTLTQLTDQLGAVSGVSTDQETTNLLTYEKAYQAAAEVVTTVDSLMQTVISMPDTTS
jgi:flagellar hook-associated protein 1 FlgK